MVVGRSGHRRRATCSDTVDAASAERMPDYSVVGIPKAKTIRLDTTELHLGGKRWWVVRPVLARQGRRSTEEATPYGHPLLCPIRY